MRIASGQVMAQTFAGNRVFVARDRRAGPWHGAAAVAGAARKRERPDCSATPPTQPSAFPSDNMMVAPAQPADDGDDSAACCRSGCSAPIVAFNTQRSAGHHHHRYRQHRSSITCSARAARFATASASAARALPGPACRPLRSKAEWPDWHPPAEMIARQPYLPRFMAGGPGNPLGARAMYLGSSDYRIHGTNDPSTIGKFVSSGCIRLTNEDVADLFSRVNVGTKVVVLPKNAPHMATRPATIRFARQRAAASGRDDGRSGPPGDEPFDVVALLSVDLRETSMNRISGKRLALGGGSVAVRLGAGAAAQAQDFFSALFGGLARRSRAPQISLPFASEGGPSAAGRDASRSYGGGQAYCVRTCDGRYFPISATDNASRAASCNSFCPASETKVVYGSTSTAPRPKPGSPIPNCRTRFATAPSWWPAAPATARTSSVWRRSRSRTIRPCARATSSPAKTG